MDQTDLSDLEMQLWIQALWGPVPPLGLFSTLNNVGWTMFRCLGSFPVPVRWPPIMAERARKVAPSDTLPTEGSHETRRAGPPWCAWMWAKGCGRRELKQGREWCGEAT